MPFYSSFKVVNDITAEITCDISDTERHAKSFTFEVTNRLFATCVKKKDTGYVWTVETAHDISTWYDLMLACIAEFDHADFEHIPSLKRTPRDTSKILFEELASAAPNPKGEMPPPGSDTRDRVEKLQVLMKYHHTPAKTALQVLMKDHHTPAKTAQQLLFRINTFGDENSPFKHMSNVWIFDGFSHASRGECRLINVDNSTVIIDSIPAWKCDPISE